MTMFKVFSTGSRWLALWGSVERLCLRGRSSSISGSSINRQPVGGRLQIDGPIGAAAVPIRPGEGGAQPNGTFILRCKIVS